MTGPEPRDSLDDQDSPPRPASADFNLILAQIDERFDQLMRESRIAAEEIGRRVTVFDRAYSAIRGEMPASTPMTPPTATRPAAPPAAFAAVATLDIDDALHEIALRQRELDAAAQLGPSRSPDSAQANSGLGAVSSSSPGHLATLEPLLRSISAQIASLRPSGVDEALGALRRDLAEIGRAIANAAPRQALETLQDEVRSLAKRLDADRLAGLATPKLSEIEPAITELRAALRAITPAESLDELKALVHALERKIDGIAAGRQDGVDLLQLESEVSALRRALATVASGDKLAELSVEVRALAEKIEANSAPRTSDAFLEHLDARLTALSDALEARESRMAGATKPDVNAIVDALHERLESSGTRTQPALDDIEQRILTFIEKMPAAELPAGSFATIEGGIAELLAQIKDLRAANSPDAGASMATETIRQDIADLRDAQVASDRRTRETLEVVQDTIGDVVDRLAIIERELHTESPGLAPALPEQAPSRRGSESWSLASASPQPDGETLPLAIDPVVRAIAGVKPRPIDPDLPPDHPLEPGSVPRKARTGTSAPGSKEDKAPLPRHEPELTAARPGTRGKDDDGAPPSTTSLIAAARRAAKAAVNEPSERVASSGDSRDVASSLSARVANLLGERAKSFLVGVSIVVIVLGVAKLVFSAIDTDATISADLSQSAAPSTGLVPEAPAAAPSTTLREATPGPRIISVEPAGRAAPTPVGGTDPTATPATPVPPPSPAAEQTQGTPPVPALQPTPTSPDVTSAIASPPSVPAWAVPVQGLQAPKPPVDADALTARIAGAPLRKAALAGDPDAAFEIGVRFAEGRGVEVDFAQAARWFERAAASGLAPAQFRLGSLYEKGLGLKKDLAEASRLYRAAAEKGNAKAMHNLAVLHAEGFNGRPDFKTAIHWFRQAADRDVSDSQYNLGVLYARGIGVDANLAESYRWFSLAARSGDGEAVKKRDEVATKLDATALAAARKAVESWTPVAQPPDAVAVKSPPGGWDPAPARAAPVKPHSRPKA